METVKTFCQLSTDEKLVLIRAFYDRRPIEFYSRIEESWIETDCPTWNPISNYRIKPTPEVYKVSALLDIGMYMGGGLNVVNQRQPGCQPTHIMTMTVENGFESEITVKRLNKKES